MRYRVILTHNPQDFFNGKEDPELVQEIIFSGIFAGDVLKDVLKQVDGGYAAIIRQTEEGDG